MRQKIIIVFSVSLLLLAVFLIARDLFKSPLKEPLVACCGDDLIALKKFDTTLVGYYRNSVIETGLINLSGITIGEDNNILLTGSGRIIIFNASGVLLEEIPVASASSCITTGHNSIYIGTGAGIARYSLDDGSITRWGDEKSNGYITSVAVNDNYLYAADAGRKIIHKYDPDGTLVQQIGIKDTITNAPGFIVPSPYFDIAFGGFSDLWAANTGRLRVEMYSVSGFIRADWGKSAYEPGGFSGCCNPAHLAILPDGCFVTYEKGIDHIKVFDQGGQFICFVGGAGSFRGNPDFSLGINNLVKDIAAGSDGKIYILDAYNRINIFEKKDL